MTQNTASPPLSRPLSRPATAAGEDDLDTLLDSIMGDDPGARPDRAEVLAARKEARQRLEQQRAEAARAREAERVTDELRSQIRALTAQVQALTEATATQAAQGRAIQELRQAMREVLVATHRQAQARNLTAELQLPSLQIKLVLAQAAHLLYQAATDVAGLASWSMFFAGITLGMVVAIGSEYVGPYSTRFWLYLAIAIFAGLVALVFAVMTWHALRRAGKARRVMDERALTRTLPVK